MNKQDTEIQERELLTRLNQQDEEAFSEVFLQYYAALCSFGRRYVDPEEAEDAVEEVFFKLLQAPFQFQNADHLKAYLYRAVKHSCLDALKLSIRSKERQLRFAEAHSEPEAAYLAHIMQTEARRLLYQSLETLPAKMAKIIQMTYLDGMTNQEAADALGVSLNTVKTHKQRALGKLREVLPKDQFATILMFACLSQL